MAIIYGINNDKKESMYLHDRITGIEDSDGLKRTIIDKINNIHPNIPIRNMIFRKSNIKLPNKKVIVILKITPSNSKPHQYNHIFYKRLVDGNEPMQVDEISRLIIDSQKNERAVDLLDIELGSLYDTFKTTKKLFEKDKNISTCLIFLQGNDQKTLNYFLYNQSYLYNEDVTNHLSRIIQYIEKFEYFSDNNKKILLSKPKSKYFDNSKTRLIKRVEECINLINLLKKELNLSLPEPLNPLYPNYFPTNKLKS